VRIADSARKHQISDEDIEHAVRNTIREVHPYDDVKLIIGSSRTGALLEIGILNPDSDDPVVIHAMTLRPRFLP
jgi:hypothetical protein